MELADLRQVWHRLGQEDPLWAVLSDARCKGGRWDPDAFFALGVLDVDAVLGEAAKHNLEFGRNAALDFGCGVGRLTQALAREFDSVTGLDITPSMIAEAQQRNAQGAKCRYLVNDRPDLSLLEDASFDFVLSLLVLQHMEARYARNYVLEFIRVLRPGGVAVFQIPSATDAPSQHGTGGFALPDGAYRARLSSPSSALVAAPGSVVAVKVSAHNPGPYAWPPFTGCLGLAVGNHWYGADGSEIRHDDGRAFLSDEVAVGCSVTVDLRVSVPRQPGRYTLELDMVHEGVTWFAQKGSEPLCLTVNVRMPRWPRRHSRAKAEERDEPPTVMEMNVIPESEVAALVKSAGGRLAWVEHRRIPGFSDCFYYVTRA